MYKPTGYYVLVEMEEVKKETDWGFRIQTLEQEKKEQKGQCIGVIHAFGPTAYKGFAGCEETGPDGWGVKIGDRFETHRYAGREVNMEGYENFRLILDSTIDCIIDEVNNND